MVSSYATNDVAVNTAKTRGAQFSWFGAHLQKKHENYAPKKFGPIITILRIYTYSVKELDIPCLQYQAGQEHLLGATDSF